jgi:hypothetical protein
MDMDETQIFRQINFCPKLFRVISTEMDNQPATNPSRGALFQLWPWLLVLLVLLFAGFIRFRLLDMPLERDEGEYAYAGQLILQGIPPYELAYNMKLPGTYFACAAGMAVFGQTVAGIHLTLMVANSLTIVFIFLLGRKLFGAVAGVAACASYGIMSVSPVVLGMAAHANHFVVLFAVPATLFLWKGCESGRRWILFSSGLLYGLAFLMKQQGIFFCAFGGMFLVWNGVRGGSVAALVKNSFAFGTGTVLPFAALCLIMKWTGVFHAFWFWTFTYAHSYVTLVPWSEGFRLLSLHLKDGFQPSGGFWFLAVLGLLLGLRDKRVRGKTFFVAFLWVFSFLGAATGLYFRGHYFILVLPAVSLLVGLAVGALQASLQVRMTAAGAMVIPLILFGAISGWSAFFQRNFFFAMSAEQVCRTIYYGFPFVESLAVSDYIETHSPPTASIAVMGSEPQIYFYSHRHSATGYIYTYALVEPQPNASRMQQEMIHEIELNKPEYLVWVGFDNSWLIHPPFDPSIFRWFDEYAGGSYERVGIVDARSDGKTIYLWDDGAKNYHGSVGQYITVYKRKNPSEIPSKAD